MGKSYRHERMEKKPKRVEPKAPRKVRYEDFVNPEEDDDSDDLFPEYEEDTCSLSHSIRS